MTFTARALGAAAALLCLGASLATAQEPAWEARVRAVYFDPTNRSDGYGPLLIPADALHLDARWIPEADLTYFLTAHWSSEWLLTLPNSQTLTVEHSALGAALVLGTFRQLPSMLTLQYDFLPEDALQPYLGLGLNVTLISDVRLFLPRGGTLDLDRIRAGPAAQVGFDYRLTGEWYLNADVKWAMVRPEVRLDGVRLSEVRIDPLLFGVGLGYRF